jgi:hypothetical protein
MHLRPSIVFASVALVIGVPTASAQTPWDSIPQAAATVKDYASLERVSHAGSSTTKAGTDVHSSAKKSTGKLFAWDPTPHNP